jgi:transcriptional regulator with XRE-family HTH domain
MAARKPRKKAARRSTHIDEAFGGLVRSRRTLAGISQTALADQMGLTFQQVQKYERGSNRISVSRLFALAAALNTTPSALLRELEEQLALEPASQPTAGAPVSVQREAWKVMRDYMAIDDPKVRKRIRALMRAVAPGAVDESE